MPGPLLLDDKTIERARSAKGNKKKCVAKSKSGSNKERNEASSSFNASALNDSSNSSWAEMELYVIGICNFIIIIEDQC